MIGFRSASFASRFFTLRQGGDGDEGGDGGGGVGPQGWGVDGHADGRNRPSAYRAISPAGAWGPPTASGNGTGGTASTWSPAGAEITIGATNPAAVSNVSGMAWHRFDLSNVIPDTDRENGTPSLGGETAARYGLAGSIEIVSDPADLGSGFTILVGLGSADVEPSDPSFRFFGWGWRSTMSGNGEIILAFEGDLADGFDHFPAFNGREVVGTWIPAVGRLGKLTAYARLPSPTNPSETAPVSGFHDVGDLNTIIPPSLALYVLQGCLDGSNDGPHTAIVRINVAPFALFQPGISPALTP